MNRIEITQLKRDALETLQGIDISGRMTKDAFLMIGACMGVLACPDELVVAQKQESDHALSVDDELRDAEKYLDEYAATKDPDYMVIAKDELRHAQILMQKAHARGEDTSSYKDRYDKLVAETK